MKLIARGRHSYIFLTQRGSIIKRFRPAFEKNFEKEIYFLTKLANYNFVPKIYSYNKNNLEIEMEYIRGQHLLDIIKSKNTLKLVYTIRRCIDICYLLDTLKIQKEEMHRPYKHVFLSGSRIVFIDWERAKETKKPSNLTQFAQFLARDKKLKDLLQIDPEFIKDVCKKYKRNFSKDLVELLKSKINKL